MPWNYPKLTRNSAKKLALILCMEVVLVSATLLAAIHCTWRLERWRMLNGNDLEWHLGLFRNWAAANCDAYDAPKFYAVCMAVFKSTFGTLQQVREFICTLDTAPLKIESQYLHEARIFSSSCDDVEQIYKVSLISLILLVLSSTESGLVFFFALRLAYKQFKRTHRIYYWLCCSFQFVACVLIFIAILVFGVTASSVLPGVFNYTDDANPDATLIQKTVRGGAFGVGFYLSILLLVLNIILTVLLVRWIPIASDEVRIVKKETTKRKKKEKAHLLEQDSTTASSSFWAYMPEVFQPQTQVVEYGAPEIIGYYAPQSVTTVTHTTTEGPPPRIDPNTGLPITDGSGYVESYSYMH